MRSQVVIAEIQTGALTRFATDQTDDTTTLSLEKFLCDITSSSPDDPADELRYLSDDLHHPIPRTVRTP